MSNILKLAAAALVGAIAAFGISAEAAQFTTNGGGGSGGGVTRAEFNRLQGQVQAIEGRVTALEHMSGHGSNSSKRANDSWEAH